MQRTALRFSLFSMLITLLTGCGGSHLRPPSMAPMQMKARPPVQPTRLTKNHFSQDKVGTISESGMRTILNAPVFLEEGARIGVVPVISRYELDAHVPVDTVTGALAKALANTGFFEVATEVTTDWPGGYSVAGLREIATRYRAEYLLLYRHRFVEQEITNGWGWSWLTVVGGLVTPQTTIETAGVLEGTLFDVKTGTLLFTVFERVHAEADINIWHTEWKIRRLKEKLISEATERLSQQVDGKLRKLVAARPQKRTDEAVVQVPTQTAPSTAVALMPAQ